MSFAKDMSVALIAPSQTESERQPRFGWSRLAKRIASRRFSLFHAPIY